jgi:hypothetical protein
MIILVSLPIDRKRIMSGNRSAASRPIALVAGARHGIGRAIVRQMAGAGFDKN